MEYNTFLFDLDGTLIDSSEGIINSVIMDFLKKKAGKRLTLTASIIRTKAFLSVSCMMGYLMC